MLGRFNKMKARNIFSHQRVIYRGLFLVNLTVAFLLLRQLHTVLPTSGVMAKANAHISSGLSFRWMQEKDKGVVTGGWNFGLITNGLGQTDIKGTMWYNPPNCSVVDLLSGPDPTVETAYNRSLVCGARSADRDIVCSLFFAQVGLEDDGDCKRPADDHRVPKIVYFVIFGNTFKFQFWNYVSIMAAKRFVSPTGLYVIGDTLPRGYWWQRVMKDTKGIRFLYRPSPTKIGNKSVVFRHHMSDLVRLQVLLLNGGIYLDMDMVVTRPLDPLLQDHDITMGLVDNGTGMGNAFIVAKRNSVFIREWYTHYNNFHADQFYHNSLHVPRNMWLENPARLHVESKRLYSPNWYEADNLFKRSDYDWSQNYAVHVWTNKNPVPKTEDEIQTANTTIAQVFRNALYGDSRPRKMASLGNRV